jgi:hypothetical protein
MNNKNIIDKMMSRPKTQLPSNQWRFVRNNINTLYYSVRNDSYADATFDLGASHNFRMTNERKKVVTLNKIKLLTFTVPFLSEIDDLESLIPLSMIPDRLADSDIEKEVEYPRPNPFSTYPRFVKTMWSNL